MTYVTHFLGILASGEKGPHHNCCKRSSLEHSAIVIGVLLFAQVAAPQSCLGKEPCSGKYRGGLKSSPAELVELLKQHEELANDPRRAIFCEANLRSANLDGVHLERAMALSVGLSNAYFKSLGLSSLTEAG